HEAALAQSTLAVPDSPPTSRLAALGAHEVDVDVGDSTGTHPAVHSGGVDLDVGAATGTHAANGGSLDLDVGTATVPDTAFAATQRLSSEDLALPALEPVTMSEVGTKLDLARAYMDMGDPDGARNILEEVLAEGSAAQKQEAQRLMESLPGELIGCKRGFWPRQAKPVVVRIAREPDCRRDRVRRLRLRRLAGAGLPADPPAHHRKSAEQRRGGAAHSGMCRPHRRRCARARAGCALRHARHTQRARLGSRSQQRAAGGRECVLGRAGASALPCALLRRGAHLPLPDSEP